MAGHPSCRALQGKHPLHLTGAPRGCSCPSAQLSLPRQGSLLQGRARARSCLSPAGPGLAWEERLHADVGWASRRCRAESRTPGLPRRPCSLPALPLLASPGRRGPCHPANPLSSYRPLPRALVPPSTPVEARPPATPRSLTVAAKHLRTVTGRACPLGGRDPQGEAEALPSVFPGASSARLPPCSPNGETSPPTTEAENARLSPSQPASLLAWSLRETSRALPAFSAVTEGRHCLSPPHVRGWLPPTD